MPEHIWDDIYKRLALLVEGGCGGVFVGGVIIAVWASLSSSMYKLVRGRSIDDKE